MNLTRLTKNPAIAGGLERIFNSPNRPRFLQRLAIT